jgi:5-methylcytosine-specific restriction endonuclease McrA
MPRDPQGRFTTGLHPKKTLEHRDKIRFSLLGHSVSVKSKEKNRIAHLGEKSHTWKGGVTYNKNYKRLKKYEYLGRKLDADGAHTKQQWECLKALFSYRCVCCGLQEPEIKLTEDHVIPLSLGGSDKIDNIQPLCMPCNSHKNVKDTRYTDVWYGTKK